MSDKWLEEAKARCEAVDRVNALPCARCGGREMWCDDCHGRDSEYDGRDLPRALAIVEAGDRLAEMMASWLRMHGADCGCGACEALAAYRKAREG